MLDLLFIYYSVLRWKTRPDLSYNEEIKEGSKQEETKHQWHSKAFGEIQDISDEREPFFCIISYAKKTIL